MTHDFSFVCSCLKRIRFRLARRGRAEKTILGGNLFRLIAAAI
ncbi:hypothetical protein HMPREF9371_1067 [Neisseria shayeganii 871]|uniref:Uncharacterized protein n=1 Tax=Neisseria shayeganii 871 TaxID=1032488 RepID=G4CHH8_9NEIS|nr:hypothetical protein HMPREF9371_1067 [Neisseria shayeganii 871]